MNNETEDTVIISKTTLLEWVQLVIRISDATAQDIDRSKQASVLANDMLAAAEHRVALTMPAMAAQSSK